MDLQHRKNSRHNLHNHCPPGSLTIIKVSFINSDNSLKIITSDSLRFNGHDLLENQIRFFK